jgi:hypothetical protein
VKHVARTLWPPRLAADLRQWLCNRHPDKDQNVLGVAANQIDGLVRDMLRTGQGGVKIKTARGQPAKVTLPLIKIIRRSPVDALRRIRDAIESGKDHLYTKAIAEAPVDVIALIEQVRGTVGWNCNETMPGVTGLPISARAAVAPHLQEAIRLASAPGNWSGWRRDRAVREIAVVFEQITGEKPRQSSKAGTSRRSGGFYIFLDDLEYFYNARLLPDGFRLKFGVQNSGSAAARIFGR